MIANVLIVDNDPQFVRFMLEILARKGIRGTVANDKEYAIDFLDKGHYDLVFIGVEIGRQTDLRGRLQDGLELLAKIKANSPELPVIMIAKGRSRTTKDKLVEAAVNAIRAGCCDFLVEPLGREKIEGLLDTFLPNRSVSMQASANDPGSPGRSLYGIVGRSAKLSQVINLAKRIAPTSVPVLISGESGTGKELVSCLVHHESRRSQGPYIRVNCAALSESLLESELFGHEKGAFTGAYTQRKGRFEMAHGGTLLLDEITDTPLKFQAKLLRILEQQDFERVGGEKQIRVDVRIISTTNKNLLQEVSEGLFRQDLYYRLSGIRLIIPPLRDHLEDLPDLVWHFVNLYVCQAQRRIAKLDANMMNIFAEYHWPGNIRQLRNVVLTSLILGIGPTLALADVSWLFDEIPPAPQIAFGNAGELRRQPQEKKENNGYVRHNAQHDSRLGGLPLKQIERQAIIDTLRQTAGNQTKAAKVLGISDRTLRDKMRQYRQQGALQLA